LFRTPPLAESLALHLDVYGEVDWLLSSVLLSVSVYVGPLLRCGACGVTVRGRKVVDGTLYTGETDSRTHTTNSTEPAKRHDSKLNTIIIERIEAFVGLSAAFSVAGSCFCE
jgi:hypothetical protein